MVWLLFVGPKCCDTCTMGTVYLFSLCDNYQWVHLAHMLNTYCSYNYCKYVLHNYCSSIKVRRSNNMLQFHNTYIFCQHLRMVAVGAKGLSLMVFFLKFGSPLILESQTWSVTSILACISPCMLIPVPFRTFFNNFYTAPYTEQT